MSAGVRERRERVSINQFIIVRAGSETFLFVLRVRTKGGVTIRSIALPDPIGIERCDGNGGSERDGVRMSGLARPSSRDRGGSANEADLGTGRTEL